MKRFYAILDQVLYWLLFLVLGSMAAIVAGNVFGRFVLHRSISWGEEVAKILLTYMTFLGAAYAMRDNSHYAFDYLVQRMPPRLMRPFLVFRWAAVIIMSSLLVYWSAEATIGVRDWIMPSTGLNRALVYAVAPVGTFFLILYALRCFVADLKEPQVHPQEEALDI